MAEWLYEAGIGENRAALVDGGHIVEMAVEWDDDGLRAGAIVPGRLTRKADATGRGRVTLAGGTLAHLAPVPPALTEGAAILCEVVRAAQPEAGASKPPRLRMAPPDAVSQDGPDLLARIGAGGVPVRRVEVRSGLLDDFGWGEALEDAARGIVVLPDLMLRISLTPAMTLIDVDGVGGAAALAMAGARAAAATIRRYDLAGSIGVDLPTLATKAERQAAAAAFDAALPPPFERTGVNGFGFLQIVRRRVRPSLMDRLAADPAGAAARALLRQAERAGGSGLLTLAAAPAAAARLEARPDWIAALERRVGASVALHAQPALAISAGYASRTFP